MVMIKVNDYTFDKVSDLYINTEHISAIVSYLRECKYALLIYMINNEQPIELKYSKKDRRDKQFDIIM